MGTRFCMNGQHWVPSENMRIVYRKSQNNSKSRRYICVACLAIKAKKR